MCDDGSTRITPSLPVAQTEPKAPTAPVAIGSFQRFTTRFFAGSMRSSSPCVNAVVHAEPYANVVSYGVNPTLIAFVRFPVATETRLTVDVFVSSIQIEPAPKPSPHEPVPMPVFETTLFVAGSIFRRYGWPYSLTQTHLPPAAAAQGAAYGPTRILATTFGAAAVVTVAASRAMSVRVMARR